MTTTYICENGHEHEAHRSQPNGHTQKAVCIDCRADIIERSVGYRKCEDCDHRWPYTGNGDRPTCPNCDGKRTVAVGDGSG